ncbi:Glycosyl transferase family 2 [Nocardioides dokdonensis FR1436]|uniref:4,4'-diaponeurosporenoate glycosyltransferase n=1 Tax=Nocardioides dokdonensis FR1436 TaxID=1300347 RepID=A0A1A9GQ80_9ACTN|nr:glycosyltransferase [Nocardioides dokdonensis]ANH39753.1 Glycosyl transferase family 2 [Nocardioides dokdonensis FR1436]
MSPVDRVVVVVPAHDEEDVLGRCLEDIADAAAQARVLRVRVDVVVVLDDCTDGSLAVASEHDVQVVETDARCVGAARALGVGVATGHPDRLAAVGPDDERRTWVATTDADSRVPGSWLLDHLAAAHHGHDLLVGPVLPDADELDPAVLAAWHDRHRTGRLHVHGANLGVRLSAYRAVGGFADLATGEDVALVQALLALDVPTVRQGRPVVTSARERGRAPDGFAGYLRALRLAVAEGEPA